MFDFLLTAMVNVQSVDRKSYFLLLGDANGHQEEWLGPSTTSLHTRAERDCASSLEYEQMAM